MAEPDLPPEGRPPEPTRPSDRAFVVDIVQTLVAYAEGRLGPCAIGLGDVDRIIAVGSDRMMAAVNAARVGALGPHLKPGHIAIASINSPMQCMLKEICGQCLQSHRDPSTGAETVVFSCANQDQPMGCVDSEVLHGRLTQDALQEKLTASWLQHCRAPAADL